MEQARIRARRLSLEQVEASSQGKWFSMGEHDRSHGSWWSAKWI